MITIVKSYFKKFCQVACTIKLIHLLALLSLGSAQLMVLIFAYWLLFPYKTSDMLEFYPLKPSVKRGEVLQFKKTVRKYFPVQVHVIRQIHCNDNTIIYLVDEARNFPLGNTTTIDEIFIPERTSKTTCHLEYDVTYQVNPLRKIVREYPSKDFIVTD